VAATVPIRPDGPGPDRRPGLVNDAKTDTDDLVALHTDEAMRREKQNDDCPGDETRDDHERSRFIRQGAAKFGDPRCSRAPHCISDPHGQKRRNGERPSSRQRSPQTGERDKVCPSTCRCTDPLDVEMSSVYREPARRRAGKRLLRPVLRVGRRVYYRRSVLLGGSPTRSSNRLVVTVAELAAIPRISTAAPRVLTELENLALAPCRCHLDSIRGH